MTTSYGVFITPRQNAISAKIERIHQAAEARSDNPFFWDYTQQERAELHRLNAEWKEASAW